jgi:hypothetical protein
LSETQNSWGQDGPRAAAFGKGPDEPESLRSRRPRPRRPCRVETETECPPVRPRAAYRCLGPSQTGPCDKETREAEAPAAASGWKQTGEGLRGRIVSDADPVSSPPAPTPAPPGSQTDHRSSARASIQSMGPPRVLLAAAITRETASSPRCEAKTWSTAISAAGAEPSTGDGGENRVRRD